MVAVVSPRLCSILRTLATLACSGCLLMMGGCSLSAPSSATQTAEQERVWRFGFYQGGDYYDYEAHFRGLVNGLIGEGLVPELDQQAWQAQKTTSDMWTFLSESGSSGRVSFEPDAFWDAEWDDALRAVNREDCTARLNAGDTDLLIAAGTWAGLDLATDDHAVPVIVISASDPVRAGIISSAQDSGRAHVHAAHDPNRYERNLRTFHRLVQFERLGLVYEDSEVGRIYGNVAIYQNVADELAFELVERHIVEHNKPAGESAQELKEIYRELAPEVDAVITTALNAEEPEYLPGILEPLFEHNVATWGQLGPAQVERGILLSVAELRHDDIGAFYAETIHAVMDGAQPGDLPQRFEDPKTLAVNLETARRIGFDVPASLLDVADQVFYTIEGE